MAEFDRAQLRQWAVRGAEQRLQEIAAEAAAIHRAFPELRDRGQRGAATATVVTAAKGRRRGRANMSAAQRKAVSERMRKYWAARREGAGGATSAGSAKAKAAAKPARAAAAKRTRGPRKMSAAARKRISDAQKKRWAERAAPTAEDLRAAVAPRTAALRRREPALRPIARSPPRPQRSRSPAIKLPECRWRSSDHSGGATGAAHFDHRSRLQRARHRGRRDRSAADDRPPRGARDHRGQRRLERRHARSAGRPPRERPRCTSSTPSGIAARATPSALA